MKLRSGRFQASYQAGGARHLAPVTFLTKGDAAAWLDMRHAELLEYRWKPAPPPDPTKVRFADYSQKWIGTRDLSPRVATGSLRYSSRKSSSPNTFGRLARLSSSITMTYRRSGSSLASLAS